MKAMMAVGSHRLDGAMCTGPSWNPLECVSNSVPMDIASKNTGKAQITSMMRDAIASVVPPKKPAIRATTVAASVQSTAEPIPISRELRPP